MARIVKPLSVTQIDALQPKEKDYNLSDGDGLYLRVRTSGTKTWIFLYKNKQDVRVVITIGNYPQYKLALAREKKRDYLSILAEGKDLKEYLNSLKKKTTQELSLEMITRKWLEQYAVRNP